MLCYNINVNGPQFFLRMLSIVYVLMGSHFFVYQYRNHDNMCRCIEEVICSIDRDVNSKVQQQIKLTERTTHDKNLLQIFYISERHLIPQLSCPFFVTFNVKLRSIATNFTNMMIDSTLSQQFWSAAVNRKMTDVEILIGGESFGAHRSLLSTRSPVFCRDVRKRNERG